MRLPRPLWIGLATILLVFAAAAVHIGVPIYRQWVAIKQVEGLGGTVDGDRFGSTWLGDRIGRELRLPLQRVTWIGLAGTPATDATVSQIAQFSELEWLILDQTLITDEGLAHLRRLLKLEGLSLNGTQVTDAGLSHLKVLSGLRHLRVDGTQVNEASSKRLKLALPQARISGNGFLIK